MGAEYSILCNMYYSGLIDKRDREMASLRTKDFIIELKREDVEKEFLDIQYCFRCVIIFKDLLGRELRRIILNEAQASILVDNINTFIYEDYTQLVALSNILSTNIYETYTISLEASEDRNEDFCILFKIMSYNSMTQILSPVITTQLSLDEIDNLNNMMFFVFLIDLASERQGIYKV